MKITYTPRDGQAKVYEYDSDDMLMAEVTAIEKAADGLALEMVELQAMAGSMTDRLILLWSCMKQDDPFLRLGALQGTVRKRELLVEFSPKDRVALREKVRKSRVSDDQKAAVYELLDVEDAEAAEKAERAGIPVDDLGPKDSEDIFL